MKFLKPEKLPSKDVVTVKRNFNSHKEEGVKNITLQLTDMGNSRTVLHRKTNQQKNEEKKLPNVKCLLELPFIIKRNNLKRQQRIMSFLNYKCDSKMKNFIRPFLPSKNIGLDISKYSKPHTLNNPSYKWSPINLQSGSIIPI